MRSKSGMNVWSDGIYTWDFVVLSVAEGEGNVEVLGKDNIDRGQ